MANAAYGSGLNLDAMVVPVKAATVYAAHENSLYLPGAIVPKIEVPAGSASAQVPLMGSVTATTITSEATPGVDFDTVIPSDTKKTINLSLHAARTVLRDLGGIDVADMGRIMGNAIATAVDKEITSKMVTMTEQEITSGNLDLDEILKMMLGPLRRDCDHSRWKCTRHRHLWKSCSFKYMSRFSGEPPKH